MIEAGHRRGSLDLVPSHLIAMLRLLVEQGRVIWREPLWIVAGCPTGDQWLPIRRQGYSR